MTTRDSLWIYDERTRRARHFEGGQLVATYDANANQLGASATLDPRPRGSDA